MPEIDVKIIKNAGFANQIIATQASKRLELLYVSDNEFKIKGKDRDFTVPMLDALNTVLISNMYPNAVQTWYDRNPIMRNFTYVGLIRPGLDGFKWTYLVPPKRRAFVENCFISNECFTAEANQVARAAIQYQNNSYPAGVALIDLLSVTVPLDVVGTYRNMNSPQSVLMNEGDTLYSYTATSAVAAGQGYTASSAKITEFDV